jgi:NAD(P)H-flavin reductase
MVFFSGPHGLPASTDDYGKVLTIATGFGITAQLPLLRELIPGFNTSVVRMRYVTLVWQLQHHSKYPTEVAGRGFH